MLRWYLNLDVGRDENILCGFIMEELAIIMPIADMHMVKGRQYSVYTVDLLLCLDHRDERSTL